MKKAYFDSAAVLNRKADGLNNEMRGYIDIVDSCIENNDAECTNENNVNLETLKKRICSLLNCDNYSNVIINSKGTMPIDVIIKSIIKHGEHCIVGCDAKSVMSGCLSQCSDSGIEITTVYYDEEGRILPYKIESMIKENTKAIVVSHASYIYGTLQAVKEIQCICKNNNIVFILDVSQTIGQYPIDLKEINPDVLFFSAEKSLFNINETNVIVVKNESVSYFQSLSDEINTEYVNKFDKTLSIIENIGVQTIREKIEQLTVGFLYGLKHIKSIDIVGTWNSNQRVGTISIVFIGKDNLTCAEKLEKEYGIIADRKTLTNSSLQHNDAVSFTLSYVNTVADVDKALNAIQEIAEQL